MGMNILLNMGLCYYAEVDGTLYCCHDHTEENSLGNSPSIVSFWQKASDWRIHYPFFTWAILEE